MAVEYRLDVRDTSGDLVAQLVGLATGGFLSLSWRRVVNAPGMLSFSLDAGSEVVPELAIGRTVEVWRRDQDNDIAWTREMVGVVRGMTRNYRTYDMLTVSAVGCLWLLATRHVLWYAGTTNRSAFSDKPAETIMKTLVRYNAGSDATTANGRLRAGVISGLSVEADGGHGNSLDWYCAYDNLLETLQKLASVGGGDFDLEPNTVPPSYMFKWYTGQRGTDRSASVVYSLDYGNMEGPEYSEDGLEERSVAVVLGRGAEDSRAVVIRTSPDYDATINNIETIVNATDVTTTAALQARGDNVLAERGRKRDFRFKALQSWPGCLYGKHVFLGDLVTARYHTSLTRKVVAVGATYDERGETLQLEFGEP